MTNRISKQIIVIIVFIAASTLLAFYLSHMKSENISALAEEFKEISPYVQGSSGKHMDITSLELNDCRLSWIEKRDDQFECQVENQKLMFGMSVDLRALQLTNRYIGLRNHDDFSVVSSLLEDSSIVFGPLPEIKLIEEEFSTAKEIEAYFAQTENAISTYSEYCGIPTRTSYQKGMSLITTPEKATELKALLVRLGKLCR